MFVEYGNGKRIYTKNIKSIISKENRKKSSIYHERYRNKHKEKIKEYGKKYYELNKKTILEKKKNKGDVRRLMEYCRTDKGLIIKVNPNCELVLDLVKFWNCTLGNIVKQSKNIIDLIEAGDYVNGHKVISIKSKIKNTLEVEAQAFLGNYFINYDDIETILTHEMYEQDCYKVGVENE